MNSAKWLRKQYCWLIDYTISSTGKEFETTEWIVGYVLRKEIFSYGILLEIHCRFLTTNLPGRDVHLKMRSSKSQTIQTAIRWDFLDEFKICTYWIEHCYFRKLSSANLDQKDCQYFCLFKMCKKFRNFHCVLNYFKAYSHCMRWWFENSSLLKNDFSKIFDNCKRSRLQISQISRQI